MTALRPWLWLRPQTAHQLGPWFLKAYGKFRPLQTLTWSPFTWRGLEFTNPLGLAGGMDKDATQIQDWWTLGPGFIEVGTITLKPQSGHSGKVIDRDVPHQALWNRLGFPSQGAEAVLPRLRKLYRPHFTPIFANLGKNKQTPLDQAHHEYVALIHKFAPWVDGFVVNISSPNTEGLRELLKPNNLKSFLTPIVDGLNEVKKQNSPLPLLLKISPDVLDQELPAILDTSGALGIDGWVLTNSSANLRQDLSFPAEGGVSGQPLSHRSKSILKQTVSHLGSQKQDKLLISCGGILTPEDVFERLDMGADLVQVYSALIFKGPFFFREVANHASLRMPKPTSTSSHLSSPQRQV